MSPRSKAFVPGHFGTWREELIREREEESGKPPNERAGNWRTVKNGDFSEDEIREMERIYGRSIKRPCPKK